MELSDLISVAFSISIAAMVFAFGLHDVDFETQQRTPQLSAAYFKEVAARNAVV